MLFAEIKNFLSRHKKELAKLEARSISLFGSIARDEETDQSDVDILVDYYSKKGLFLFIELKIYLEKLLNRDVDLVTKRALHPALKKRILREAKHVFKKVNFYCYMQMTRVGKKCFESLLSKDTS